MGERTYEQISNLPAGIIPLSGDELAELEQDGVSRKFSMSALGGVPSAHSASHKFGGSDVVGTQDKTANAIPMTDGDGTLDVFVSDASTTVKGKVQLATDGESAASKAVQSNDTRLSNARTPTAHAASHLGGSDTLGLGTAAFLNSGAANGVCPLNASSQVDSGYLPSYVDDVIEVANFAALPVTGESGKIYVTLDDNLTYRWSGSAYVEISKSLALGETSSTAYRGDRGKTAYDHSQATGNPHGTAISDISTLTGKITPLSDLNRVFRLTGNGIPTFPDNVAGTVYHGSNFTSIDGWNAWDSSCSITSSGGKLIATGSGSRTIIGILKVVNTLNKLLVVKCEDNSDVTHIGYYNDSIVVNTTPIRIGGFMFFVAYTTGTHTSDTNILFNFGGRATTSSDVIKIADVYAGSGLFDTPVYGADGKSVWTNYGVLAVPGERGNAMLFQGGQKLVSKEPIQIKNSLAFKIYIDNNQNGFNIVDNLSGGNSGIIITRETSSGVLKLIVGDGSQWNYYDLVDIIIGSWVDYEIVFGNTVVTIYKNGVFYKAMNVVNIGTTTQVLKICEDFNGMLSDIRCDYGSWTADGALRYHNGDDAVDSQQKATTPVPHSIMTRKSDGRTEVATGVDALDAVNKGQLDAACAEFLYQSYTAGDTFTAGQLGYLHTDGKVYLYDANAEASAKGALYIAIGAITANNVGTFQRGGEYTTTGLSAGAIYYGSETPGAITTTAPTTSGAIVRKVGFAQSSTVLFFNPSNDYVVLV